MAKVEVLSELCKSCSMCVAICPKKILEIGDKANAKGYYAVTVNEPDKCIGCAMCATMCPDLALEIWR